MIRSMLALIFILTSPELFGMDKAPPATQRNDQIEEATAYITVSDNKLIFLTKNDVYKIGNKTYLTATDEEIIPAESVTKSIIAKAKAADELKKTFNQVVGNKKSNAIGNYTQTQALFSLLKLEGYSSSEPNQKDFIRQFLDKHHDTEYKKTSDESNIHLGIFDASKDEELISIFSEMLVAEKDNNDKFVFYHAVDEGIGFLYDIYSEFRQQLELNNILDHKTLRALDLGFNQFMSVHDFIKTQKQLYVKYGSKAFNYTPNYMDFGISANTSLFANYPNDGSYSVRYFMTSHSESPPPLKSILRSLYYRLGYGSSVEIENRIQEYIDLFKKLEKTSKDKRDSSELETHHSAIGIKGNGRMLQIFISPDVVDDVAYISEVGGYPLYLTMAPGEEATYRPRKILSAYTKNPVLFENLLFINRHHFKFQEGRQSTNYPKYKLASILEARLFLKPEVFHDPNKVIIKDYQRFPNHYPSNYKDIIKQMIEADIKRLIISSNYSSPEIISPNIPLRKLSTLIRSQTFNSPPKITNETIAISIVDHDNEFVKNYFNIETMSTLNNPGTGLPISVMDLAIESGNREIIKFLNQKYALTLPKDQIDKLLTISCIDDDLQLFEYVLPLIKNFEVRKLEELLKTIVRFNAVKIFVFLYSPENTPILGYPKTINQQFYTDTLFLASQYNSYRIAVKLLEWGADMNYIEPEKIFSFRFTPLAKAIENDSAKTLKIMMTHSSFKDSYLLSTNTQNVPALHFALENKAYDCLPILLTNKKARDMVDREGNTFLNISLKKNYIDFALAAFSNNANYLIPNNNREYPLLLAIQRYIDAPKFLAPMIKGIIEGSSPNIINTPDKYGNTALFEAVLKNVPIIDLLMQKQADPFIPTIGGQTPLGYAMANGLDDLVTQMTQKSTKTQHNQTGMNYALFEVIHSPKAVEYIQTLLELGANVNSVDNSGTSFLQTLLYFCEDDMKLISFIFNNGKIDVNFHGEGEEPALHQALRIGNIELIKLIINKGANLDAVNDGGEKAIDIANQEYEGDKLQEVIKLLTNTNSKN